LLIFVFLGLRIFKRGSDLTGVLLGVLLTALSAAGIVFFSLAAIGVSAAPAAQTVLFFCGFLAFVLSAFIVAAIALSDAFETKKTFKLIIPPAAVLLASFSLFFWERSPFALALLALLAFLYLVLARYIENSRPARRVIRYRGGGRYEGMVVRCERNGEGVYEYPDGGRYEGEWRDGARSGRGTYYYPNRDRYEGDYKDDAENGVGTLYYAGGDRYEGSFENGRPEGDGIYYCADKRSRVGQWKTGCLTGYVIEYGAGGLILRQGLWADGDFTG